MAPRKRIGLIFSYNEHWIAGTYYILNCIHALNTLPTEEKPTVVILTNSIDNYKTVLNETKYPFLEYFEYPFPKLHYRMVERIANKVSRFFINRNLIIKITPKPIIDFLFPVYVSGISENLKKINWIPDFQEEYLPHLFSEKEIRSRKRKQIRYAESDVVVFSSKDSLADFNKLYPDAKAERFVMPFAVTHPNFSQESINELLKNYQLPKNYFFAPNQFWSHKNHIVILKAVKHLKEKGIPVVVAMSGKESDFRNQSNIETLKKFVLDHSLKSNIRFLGFLPRNVQLCLFKNAEAIIQPSLFEGWSTVLEDAKALGKFVMVSDLKVHREQLNVNAYFFDPHNYEDLAACLEIYLSNKPTIQSLNYENSIFEFGKKFQELINMGTN